MADIFVDSGDGFIFHSMHALDYTLHHYVGVYVCVCVCVWCVCVVCVCVVCVCVVCVCVVCVCQLHNCEYHQKSCLSLVKYEMILSRPTMHWGRELPPKRL